MKPMTERKPALKFPAILGIADKAVRHTLPSRIRRVSEPIIHAKSTHHIEGATE